MDRSSVRRRLETIEEALALVLKAETPRTELPKLRMTAIDGARALADELEEFADEWFPSGNLDQDCAKAIAAQCRAVERSNDEKHNLSAVRYAISEC